MIADHYFTSKGYFTSHSVFLLYNQSNLSVISFTQQTDKLELRLSALVSRLINWNLQRGAHPEQRCHLRTSAPASVGISIEISDYLSSSIRRGRVSRPPEFRDLYGAGRETRPLRCFYGWPDKYQFAAPIRCCGAYMIILHSAFRTPHFLNPGRDLSWQK